LKTAGLAASLIFGIASIATWAQQTPNSRPIDQGRFADVVPFCPADSKINRGFVPPGSGVIPPKAIYSPEADFTDEARLAIGEYLKENQMKHFEALSVVWPTVDSNGKPVNLCVGMEAGFGLDRRALDTVAKYRFKPATLDGKPVPFRSGVEVKFRMY
jgi:hypothetical protein